MVRLSDDAVRSGLEALPGWDRNGDEIVRTIRFPEFMDGIRFIAQVAELAEAVDHHPDIDIRWNKVTLTLTTHDEGGLTEKDFALARKFDEL